MHNTKCTPAHTIMCLPPHIEGVPAIKRRELAEAGPKVKIGCLYQPRMQVSPAFYRTPPRPMGKIKRAAIAVLSVAGVLGLYRLGALLGGA